MFGRESISDVRMDGSNSDIDIVIKNLEDAFSHFDYVSFREKSLNGELEDYIFRAVKRFSLKKEVRLVIHAPEGKSQSEFELLKDTIHSHFSYKAREFEYSMSQQFIQWRINMLIGVLCVILCLILMEILDAFSYINAIKVIKESLLIVGWVALWEPVAFILFGWQSIKKDKLYCRKLCSMPIRIEKYIVRDYRNKSYV
jgi:hypothetical protein